MGVFDLNKAIILAGGKGERLRPYTEDKPKCMIPVLGNPLLSFTMRLLRAHGFSSVTICGGYLHEVVEGYFGDGSKWGLKIDYLVEKEPLGRGGAMRNALEHIQPMPNESVLAMNGDMLTNLNLSEFINFWINAGIYLLDPKIIEDLPKVGDHEETTFPKLSAEGTLKAYQTRAFWRTIDTVKDLTEARSEFEQIMFGAFFQPVAT